MKKHTLVLLLCLPMLASCERVPVGVFGVAGGEAGPVMINQDDPQRDEWELGRLQAIDRSIDESLKRLDAALDPNSPPANLDKLVMNDEVDPSLKNDIHLYRRQVQINQLMDQKNQDLIDNRLTGLLRSLPDGDQLATHDDLWLTRRDEVDAGLLEKTQAARPDYEGLEADRLAAEKAKAEAVAQALEAEPVTEPVEAAADHSDDQNRL